MQSTPTPTDEQDLRTRAEARVAAKEGFRIHLVVFVLVNALLWLIWAWNGAEIGSPWPIFVTLGWGIGLVAHWYSVYGQGERRREAEIQREIARMRGDDRER